GRLGLQRDLRPGDGEPPGYQPGRPPSCPAGALPEGRPSRLRSTDFSGQNLGEEEVRAGELFGHAESVRRGKRPRLFRAHARLVEVVQLPIGQRGVVEQDLPRLPELTGDLEQLVEDRYRLFVTPQPGERQRLASPAAQR